MAEIDTTRIDALASILRQRRATAFGLGETLHEMREARRDLSRRLALTRHNAEFAGPAAIHAADQMIAVMENELSDLHGRIAVAEVELAEAGAASGAARANMETVLAYCDEAGIAVPRSTREAINA